MNLAAAICTIDGVTLEPRREDNPLEGLPII